MVFEKIAKISDFAPCCRFHQTSFKRKIWTRGGTNILRTVLESWECILSRKNIFGEIFSILVPFCNQNGMITLITKIFVIKVIIPFWLQKGTKIEKISPKIFFLESMHSQLSKTVLRMFVPPLVHILRLNEVWWKRQHGAKSLIFAIFSKTNWVLIRP